MNTLRITLRCLILLFAVILSRTAQAVWIENELPKDLIKVTASSEYGPQQTAQHLVDGAGMEGGLHDNDGTSKTMWHTIEQPRPTSPAAGLPTSPAWVRFDFLSPQKFDSIHIWNHNQANLVDRGFRKARILGSPDGASWIPLTAPEVTEIPQASGSPGLEAFIVETVAKNQPLRSVVILAEAQQGNYGSSVFGLSAVRFGIGKEVAEADLPRPTKMACAALPYAPYRPDGKPGREIAISLQGGKLYGEATVEVECAGATEQTTVASNTKGTGKFSVFLPATVNPTNEYEATVVLHSGSLALKESLNVPACKPRVYYVLMHSHCDIGYTDIQPHIADKQAKNVILALKLIEQTKDFPSDAQFRWNTEVFWQVEQFYKIATAEQKKNLEPSSCTGTQAPSGNRS